MKGTRSAMRHSLSACSCEGRCAASPKMSRQRASPHNAPPRDVPCCFPAALSGLACCISMRHKAGAPAGRRPMSGLALSLSVVYSVPVAVTNTQDALSAMTMPRRRYFAATWAAIAHAGSVCQVYVQRRVVASKAHRASPSDAGVRPIYETAAMPDRPRLLLVSYHFPPNPSVGGLRWQKMARIAYARGWGLDVIMADPRALPSRDDGRLADLPPGVALYAVAERDSRLDALVDRLWTRGRQLARHPSAAAGVGASVPRRVESYTQCRGRDEFVIGAAVARAYSRLEPV